MMAGDDEALIETLEGMGFACERPRWDDAGVAWDGYDAVLIRTTWDYQERLEAFLAWTERVAGCTRLWNPVEVVRANVDKRYLRLLEEAGAAIVPTAWLEGAVSGAGIREALSGLGATRGAIKPVVGAGASGLMMFESSEAEAAAAHARALIDATGGAMAQAQIESIRTRGELSVVLIEGEITHAVRKTPSAGEWRVQIEFGGRYALEAPGAREREIAMRAVEALTVDETPLYARVDLVEVAGVGPAVIEAELIEPELFFPMSAEAAEVMGRALARRLGVQLGSRA